MGTPDGFLCDRTRKFLDNGAILPSDHVLMIGGSAANQYLRVWTEYFNSTSSIHEAVNVNEYFYLLAKIRNYPFVIMPKTTFPFFLGLYTAGPDPNDPAPVFCLRDLQKDMLLNP